MCSEEGDKLVTEGRRKRRWGERKRRRREK